MLPSPECRAIQYREPNQCSKRNSLLLFDMFKFRSEWRLFQTHKRTREN